MVGVEVCMFVLWEGIAFLGICGGVNVRVCWHYAFWCQFVWCLTLKEPGRNPPPSTFVVISQLVVIFSRWNFKTFFFKPYAWFKTIFLLKIGPKVMTRGCVIERWVQRKTDQKLIFNGNYTQIVFFVFRIHFHYVLSYLFGLFGVTTCVSILWHTSLPKNATFAWKN